MSRTLYEGIGAAGALVGVNLIAILMGLHAILGPVISCQIAEAVAILTIAGFAYDLLPDKFRKNVLMILLLAVAGGFCWEILTFMALESSTVFFSVMIPWLIYGLPTIIFIGFPVLLISSFMRKKRKMIVDVTGKSGLVLNFFVCMIFAVVMLWALLNYGAYDAWRVWLRL